MKTQKNPEQWPLTKINARIDELYKKIRELSASLLDLNIKQYDDMVSKDDAYVVLSLLASRHVDLEEELFKLEKIAAQRKAEKGSKGENGLV